MISTAAKLIALQAVHLAQRDADTAARTASVTRNVANLALIAW